MGEPLPASERAAHDAFAAAFARAAARAPLDLDGLVYWSRSSRRSAVSLLARLEESVRSHPQRPAITNGEERLSYAALFAAIERRARELSGGALVVLDGARPVAFLVDFFAARRLSAPALSHPSSTPPALRELRETAVGAATQGGRDATVFFSSGSVAPAKAVPLSDSQLEAAALAFGPWGELRHGDRLAIGLSPAQILGFVRGALNTLLVGAEAVFYRPQRDPLAEAERLGATSVLLAHRAAAAGGAPFLPRAPATRCAAGAGGSPTPTRGPSRRLGVCRCAPGMD